MAVTLDSDERAKVEAARVTPRPNYFNASIGAETPITEDFEAFLILQDIVTISAALTWLAAAGAIGSAQIDRNALAFEALIVEQADVTDRIDDVTDKTTAFEAFRAAFQAGKFSDTPEVGLILADMQEPAAELYARLDRLEHLRQVHTRVQSRLGQAVSSSRLRQLQSWPTPLLTY